MFVRANLLITTLAATLLVPLPVSAVDPAPMPDLVLTDHGRSVHFAGLLFDGHNDLPWAFRKTGHSSFDEIDIAKRQPQLHTDIPRLREGGLKAQFWSVYVPADTMTTGDSLLQTLEQIDIVDAMVQRYDDVFEIAATADDVERIADAGKIACMMGIEGGHSIEGSLANLKRLYDRGCRYMTLTHSKTLSWADSATDDARHGGLTEFGKEVVREMNRIGMLVDLSHVSPAVMKQAIGVSAAPIIFSHSSAAAINDHPRNVPDDVLPLVAANGGVVMVNFYSKFVVPSERLKANESSRGSIHDVVDHLEHVIRIAGIDHVGIGSDFDGVPRLPTGLDDVSKYPLITQALLDRGYSEADVHKVLGGNVMRALRGAETAAAKLSR
ncbi:Membrane dipeptidase (Peptidase family M19) [Stieleria maiorica]|uniref:Membrane dipeptidase (Peptidase family M19) n=1 Tax=Stieleria maiorica TaxID=2795974 RepID=A0A5B9MSX0_9BACT|nr:dipeptidase [Stieleria maiorica]QEG02856.1 Membrane dipeptidase (Peptidase family M19) [Stieleria maiorica]